MASCGLGRTARRTGGANRPGEPAGEPAGTEATIRGGSGLSSRLDAGDAAQPGNAGADGQQAATAETRAPGALPPAAGVPPPPRRARGSRRPSRRGARASGGRLAAHLLRWGLGPAAVALFVASILVGRQLLPPAARPYAPAAPASSAAATGTGTGLQAPAIEARADAGAAAAAASQAADAVQSAQALLSAAGADLRTVLAMASAQHARQPDSEDPAPLLAVFRETTARIRQLSASAVSAELRATRNADAAVRAGSEDPGAAGSATAATRAARQARASTAALKQAVAQSTALSGQARQAVASWQRIHAEPAGYLGIQVANPPSGSTVHGCQAVSVEPGSPAAAAGLTGDAGGAPSGDVIAMIADSTNGGTDWPIADCAAFSAAMAQTRAGDAITVVYYHPRTAGGWLFDSGDTSLETASGAGCPAALSGTVSPGPGGGRVEVQVDLSGPAGRRSALTVRLDSRGADTILPDAVLRRLGYSPYASAQSTGATAGTTVTENLYHIPGEAISVADGGSPAALATGTLTVIGVPGGNADRLGRGVLGHGARLAVSGARWTLTPPCS